MVFSPGGVPVAAGQHDRYLRRFYAPPRPEWLPALLEKRLTVVRFLDALITKYRLDEARVVGFTSMFQETLAACAFARLLKRRNPELLVVIGGSSCESPAGDELVSRIPDIDYAFSGPALVSFPRFVGHVMEDAGQRRNRRGVREATAGSGGRGTGRRACRWRTRQAGDPAAACVGEARHQRAAAARLRRGLPVARRQLPRIHHPRDCAVPDLARLLVG